MSNLHKWYSRKGWATSAVDVPVRSAEDAREIEALLNEGWQYQKAFVTADDFDIKADEEAKHQAVLTATTGDIDRDQEVVDVKGLSLKMFNKNPLICWGHSYDIPPIGKALWTKADGDKLKSLVQFALRPADWPAEAEWFPDQVFALCQQKILRGVSIGFLSTDASPPTEKEIKARNELAACRKIIRKSMLIEISVVPIGCNPNALIDSVSKGLVSKSLYDLCGIVAPQEEDLDLWAWDTKDCLPEPEAPQIVLPSKTDLIRKILSSRPK